MYMYMHTPQLKESERGALHGSVCVNIVIGFVGVHFEVMYTCTLSQREIVYNLMATCITSSKLNGHIHALREIQVTIPVHVHVA